MFAPAPPKPLLVGLLGYARGGKDSAAAALVEQCGFHRLAFADALKDTLLDIDPTVVLPPIFPTPSDAPSLTPLSRHSLRDLVATLGWERAKEIPEVRRLLQATGAAVRAHVADDAWLAPTIRDAEQHRRAATPVVVSDVRYPNEADALRAAGALLVWIHRPGVGPANAHPSENSLSPHDADLVIENDTDLDTLADEICSAVHLADVAARFLEAV